MCQKAGVVSSLGPCIHKIQYLIFTISGLKVLSSKMDQAKSGWSQFFSANIARPPSSESRLPVI
jgi:hypothetical protein